MVNRYQKLSKFNSLLIFGARGTGKSTLLRSHFRDKNVLWIDLLTSQDEDLFGRHPDQLSTHLIQNKYDYVVIDEIQKFPKLLDIVHREIERSKTGPHFILTGSSARKLKRNNGNLLAGRARLFYLFPFTHFEIGNAFNLNKALQYGTLPEAWLCNDKKQIEDFLRTYVKTYLREEILVEQLVRRIDPFRDFLEVAAQMNGEIINFSKMARDIGSTDQTIKSFFQVLEDTLVGFLLPPFHRSIRKRQRESPKFYFFDLGVSRTLSRQITVAPQPRSSEYGKLFEQFIILEIFRTCEYLKNDYRLSYLRTKDDAEIDLVIERPGSPDVLLEIKSTQRLEAKDVKTIKKFLDSWDKPVEAFVWSLDPISKKIDSVTCLPWESGFKNLFKNI